MSISDSFYKPDSSIEDVGISMIVYGDPGVGKTSLPKTLLGWEYGKGYIHKPYFKKEEVFVIDVECGESVLAHKGKRVVTSYRVTEDEESLLKFKDVVKFLHEMKHPFKLVVVDNMSELEKFFLMALTKRKELNVPRQKEWGDDAFYMRKNIRDLRNLTYKGVNIIFNFWAMIVPIEDKEGHISSYMAPMVMRSTTMEYIGLVEHTAFMGVSDKGSRFLQFESNKLIKCKRRDEGDGAPILQAFEKPNLADIFRRLKGGSNG
jgi:GTPase SAR1 family protein